MITFDSFLQGRIHQIEYAMEAVKQGSATVGLKSKTHAVLVALKVTSKLYSWDNNVSRKVLVWQISFAQSELLCVM